jgi:hypothetical protein
MLVIVNFRPRYLGIERLLKSDKLVMDQTAWETNLSTTENWVESSTYDFDTKPVVVHHKADLIAIP